MKNIYFLLLMIGSLCAYTACSDDDVEPSGAPVDNIQVPLFGYLGDEFTITGIGFAENSKILFRDTEGKTVEMPLKSQSVAEIIVTIPEDLPTGGYVVVLRQGGDWDLRMITINIKCPVSEYILPKEAEVEKVMKISGKGFTDEVEVYMEPEDGDMVKMEGVEKTETGIQFMIPEGFATGVYTVYIRQDGNWALGIMKVIPAGPRPIKGIEIKGCYIDENGTILDDGDGGEWIEYESYIALEYDDQERIISIDFGDYAWTVDYSVENKITMTSTSGEGNSKKERTAEYTIRDGVAQSYAGTVKYMTYIRVNGQRVWVSAEDIVDYTVGCSPEGFLNTLTGTSVQKVETLPDASSVINYTWNMEGGQVTSVVGVDDYGDEMSWNFEDYTGGYLNNTVGVDLSFLLSREFDLEDANMRLLGIAGKNLTLLPVRIVKPDPYDSEWDEHYKLEYKSNIKGQLDELKIIRLDEDAAYFEYERYFYSTTIYKLIY